MKKLVIMLFLTVLVFAPIFANSQQEQPTSEGPSTVTLWSYMGGNEGIAIADLVKEYNLMQDKFIVEVEYVPFSDIKKKYSMGLIANELPDLGFIDNPDMASFISIGLFEDITDKVATWGQSENYFPGPLKSSILNGRNYGLPATSKCLAMFYNKDILSAAGVEVPKTWDDLLSTGKKISKDGTYALALSAVKTEEGVFQYLPWYLSSGAKVETPNSPEGIKAIKFYHTLVEENIMSSEVISWSQGDVQKQFSSGRAAMMINGPWNIASVLKDSPDMNWGIAMIPKDKEYSSVLGGENIGIIKGGNVEGAWDFLKYYSSVDVMDEFINKTGYFPPRKDVTDKSDRWNTDEHLSVFMEQMQFAMPRGPHPKWPQISAALAEGMQIGLLGIKTPEEAMAEAQSKIDEALED